MRRRDISLKQRTKRQKLNIFPQNNAQNGNKKSENIQENASVIVLKYILVQNES
jgi:hypothetical protein